MTRPGSAGTCKRGSSIALRALVAAVRMLKVPAAC